MAAYTTVSEATEINVKVEIKRALEAYRQRLFFITINGHQPESLEDILVLTEKSEVMFVRVMPLVGG